MKVSFEKWEGLGNDFVVVRGDDVGSERATLWCDRRRGIGADGVLAISDERGGTRMVVRNADGSRPEMCGNGVRCVVGSVAAERGIDCGELSVWSDAGERSCQLERSAADSYEVTVAMGRARMDGPITKPAFEGRSFVRVDVGNPHAVSFGPFGSTDIDVIGPALERATEGGINVELCRVVDPQRIEVVVWERGVGRTMACGTGACAVAAAAVSLGISAADEPLYVVLPGGPLRIIVARDTFALLMRGPARCVYRGVVEADGLD
jgi:diaminopimelate epimerase